MKSHIMLPSSLLLLILGGCQVTHSSMATAASPAGMTPQQEEAATRAIASRIEQIIEAANRLDVPAALEPYSSDAAFRYVGPDGAVMDFQAMRKTQEEGFATLASMYFETTRQEITFLSSELAVCTWVGVSEVELKSGERMRIDPYVGSMIFRKSGREWKIVYAHETAAEPVMMEEGR